MNTQSSNIVAFQFQNHPARVIQDEAGNPWWVAKDVCDILGYANPSDTISTLDEDEKNTLRISEGIPSRGNPNVNVINESGLYTLIIRSNKPEAKPFRKWITAEVLPSIRKTGGYAPEASIAEMASRLSNIMMNISKAGWSDLPRVKTLCWLRTLGLPQDMAARAAGIGASEVQAIEWRLKNIGIAFTAIQGAARQKRIDETFETLLSQAARTLLARDAAVKEVSNG
jgi:prophage antirepressor-like protein